MIFIGFYKTEHPATGRESPTRAGKSITAKTARVELLTGAGELQVPCLRIAADSGEVTWMRESRDIIDNLERRFALDSLNVSPAAS